MQKLNEIKYVIKELESCILNDEEFVPISGLNLKNTVEDLLTSRRVLLWVIKTQPRKKKDVNNKKLEEFDVKKPT